MKIIQPAHNKPASEVESWEEIKDDALELRDMIRKDSFTGYYSRAYAVSHAQVSDEPKRFFVVNENIENGKLKKDFGGWCVINLKIIKFGHPVSIEEACMSFPFRRPKKMNRMAKIKATYQVPFWFGILRKKTKNLEGLAAFICQHENEHSSGKSIYFK